MSITSAFRQMGDRVALIRDTPDQAFVGEMTIDEAHKLLAQLVGEIGRATSLALQHRVQAVEALMGGRR